MTAAARRRLIRWRNHAPAVVMLALGALAIAAAFQIGVTR